MEDCYCRPVQIWFCLLRPICTGLGLPRDIWEYVIIAEVVDNDGVGGGGDDKYILFIGTLLNTQGHRTMNRKQRDRNNKTRT